MVVFVLNKHGKPLMPCTPCKAKKLLRNKRARVVRKTPFTIKLLGWSSGYVQKVIVGMDTGSKKVGVAAISNNKVLYQSEIALREDIVRKMKQRASYRRTRRVRKLRYRAPRFSNRGKKGFLAPSMLSKINSHLKEKKFVESILPVSEWILETANFDIHKITSPTVKGKGYCKGVLKDYYNVKQYILHRDNYKCQKCKKSNLKLHVHHIVFRSKGGTNEPSNLICLCDGCHDKLHKGMFTIKGSKSKTKYATEMNILRSQLKNRFGNFKETFGYITKYTREQILKLEKSHINDAISIACSNKEIICSNTSLFKKSVSKGDYKQTNGIRSEKRIPTGKLFGFRKFDKVKYNNNVYFIKGRMSSGYAVLCDIFSKKQAFKPTPKFNKMIRVNARKSIQLMEVII